MNLSDIPEEAFASKLLDPVVHERLLADLDRIVGTAGVPRHAIWSRMSKACTDHEIDWVRYLRTPANSGLVFVGKNHEPPVDAKMVAITGACLRNYTDARLMSVQDVIRRLKDDSMPLCTVLLIPNFCLEKEDGGDIPTWEITNLMGMLIDRASRNLKTVLAAPSMPMVEKQYGKSFRRHLEGRFCLSDGTNELHLPQE